MKKLLTFLTLLTLSIGVSWAASVTYSIGTSSPGTWSTTLGGSNGTATKSRYITTDEGFTITQFNPSSTNNASIGAINAGYMGLLATDNLTISGTKTITKIEYSFTYYQTTYSCDVGSLTGNTATGQNANTLTWEGSATSITLTPATGTKQNRLASITITYEEGGTSTCATPTFSPAAGTYSEAQEVTISCTTSGATIHYTTDGNDPTTESEEYNGAITVSETTTIKAIAVKEGMNNSAVASATYTIDEPTEVELNYQNTLINSHTDFYIIDRSLGGLSQVWKNSSYGITANGQNRTEAVESWLYSPVFDATSKSGYTISLNFEENLRYFASSDMPTSQATLWVREGTTGEWQQLTITPHANVDNNNFHSIETIDLSAYAGKKFQLAFKYIADTENAPGRWELKNLSVTATKEASTDLYILGMVNGNGVQPNQGVKMTYDGNNYNAKIWVIGNSSNAMGVPGTWFAFTTVLAENNDDGGWGYVNQNRYSPTPSDGIYYWLNSGANEGALVSDEPLTKQNNNNAFLIPAGLYEITVSGDLSKFSLTSIKNLKPTITPEGGEVLLNSTATIALAEDFNDFIADCNPVVTYAGSPVSITAPVAKLFVNDNAVVGTSSTYTFSTAGSTTLTGKGALVVNGNDQYAAKTNSQDFTVVEPSEGSVYTLVTSASELDETSDFIIVSKDYESAMGEQGSNNRRGAEVTINGNNAIASNDVEVFSLEGNATDGWYFKATKINTGYLYAASNSSNHLKTEAEPDANGNAKASISIDASSGVASVVFQGTNSRNVMQYNSGSDLFACYSEASQKAVYLYKKGSSTPVNKSEAPVITPEATTVIGGNVNVTITAADGAAIYYTTTVGQTGTNPNVEDDDQLYSGPFVLTHTGGYKTVTAIAVEEGKEPSDPVSKTYLFTSPEAPTFSPDASTIQSDDFYITINTNPDYVGAVIYYMLDPTTAPNGANDVRENGTVYNAETGVPVTGHGQHTIYAIVELNGLKSSVATATYTIFSQGDEGDWKLVTNLADIKDGRKYIIVNCDHNRVVSAHEGNLGTRFTSVACGEQNVLFGPGYATATVAGDDVHEFFFETEENNIYFKDANTYYNLTSDVSQTSTKTPVYISMENGFVYIKGSVEATKSLAYNSDYGNYFGMYATPTSTTGSQRPIYLYYRDTDVTPSLTLAELCATGVKDKDYIIADKLQAVYAYTKGGNSLLWCKDLGNQSIYPTTIHSGQQIDFMRSTDINYDTEHGVNNGQQGEWDQSNWIVLQFTNPTGPNNIDQMLQDAQDKFIKPGTIKGKLVDDENYILKMDLDMIETLTPADAEPSEEQYVYNVYCPANFLPDNLNIHGGIENGDGAETSTQNYFFMNPKVQEVCYITYAQWNEAYKCFTVPSTSGIPGAFQAGWVYQDNPLGQENDGTIYKFHAVVHRVGKQGYGPNNPISTKDGMPPIYENITVLPVDLDPATSEIITGINTVETGNGEVKSVKYVNVAGIVSDRPFQGVNIVVTEYTDGSRTTTKMLKK